jgi:hypothetical protein
MTTTLEDARNAVRLALARAKYLNYIPAVMGRDDGGGSFTFTVPGGRGFTYVRVVNGGNVVSTATAINRAGIANTGDLPIWLDKDIDGKLIIISARFVG